MQPHGIQTTINHTRFRSRLEARWATFFDLIGWRWEYEPFDTDHYIPDFVLLGEHPVLVEIKPAITAADYEQHTARIDTATKGTWDRDIVILGATPIVKTGEGISIGLLGEAMTGLDPNDHPDGFYRCWDWGLWHTCGCGIRSFHHCYQSYGSRICGHYDGTHHLNPPNIEAIETAWAQARTITQWEPSR